MWSFVTRHTRLLLLFAIALLLVGCIAPLVVFAALAVFVYVVGVRNIRRTSIDTRACTRIRIRIRNRTRVRMQIRPRIRVRVRLRNRSIVITMIGTRPRI